jgi:hypothetical protein
VFQQAQKTFTNQGVEFRILEPPLPGFDFFEPELQNVLPGEQGSAQFGREVRKRRPVTVS